MATTPNRPSIAQRANRFAVLGALLFGMAVGCNAGDDTTPQATEAPSATTTTSTLAALPEPHEDEPGFDCRIHGNDVCGPGSGVVAGCYYAGELVVPWREEMRGNPDACLAPTVIGTYEVPTGDLTVYSDGSARFDPSRVCNRDAGPCREGELTGVDRDGELMFAHDLNGDGVISGDVEYGS